MRPGKAEKAAEPGWTKDKAGAYLAGTTGYSLTFALARDPAERLTRDHPHTAVTLISLAVATLAYRLGLWVMRKLP